MLEGFIVLIMVMVKMRELIVSNTFSVVASALGAEFPCPSIIISDSLNQSFWLILLPKYKTFADRSVISGEQHFWFYHWVYRHFH